MQGVGLGEQEHIGARVGARKAGARAPVAFDERASLTAAFDPSGDLLARVAAHALKKAQQHGLIGALQAPITEAAHRARNELVTLTGRHRKINLDRPVQKGL